MTTSAPPRTSLASADVPTPAPSRSPQLLRRLQLVVALVLVLAGGLAAWMIQDLRADLATTPELAQQYARLGDVRHQLNTAATEAARGALLGEPATGTHSAAAGEAVATAAGLLVEAAQARPQDADLLSEAGQGVVRYGKALAAAAGNPRAKAVPLLAAADVQLDTVLDGIGTLQQRLGDEATVRPAGLNAVLAWLPGLALLAVVVWASWLVARLSHRVLNVGLVGSGIAVVVVLALALGAQSAAAQASEVARGTQFGHIVQVATAVDELDRAQRVLTTGVLRHEWTADSQTALDEATSAASDAATSEDLPSLKAFRTASTTIVGALRDGDWTTATATVTAGDEKSLAGATEGFLDSAAKKTAAAVQRAAAAPESAGTELAIQLVAAVAVALAGAFLGVLGLGRRLQEYR